MRSEQEWCNLIAVCKRSMHNSVFASSNAPLHCRISPVVVVSCTFPKCSQRGRFMQSQRPFYVPSSFNLSTKKRSPSQTATQLSAVEEGETFATLLDFQQSVL